MTEPEEPEPDATVLYDQNQDKFPMARWAPWEWMVYEFEHGLAHRPIQVWPRPLLGSQREIGEFDRLGKEKDETGRR